MSLSVAGTTMPGGLAYMAASLRRAGHDPEILDGYLASENEMIARLRSRKHEMLAISCVCATAGAAAQLAQRARRELGEGLFIVAGGQGPSGMEKKFFELAPAVDAVVVGEGEEAICEIANRLDRPQTIAQVPGVLHQRNGEVIVGPPPRLIADLDSLPFPALDLLNIADYVPSASHYRRLPVATVTSSRGCPNSCMFCFKISGNTIRMRSPENVVAEILLAHERHGAREIIFWDENFTHDRGRVLDICERLRAAGNPVVWWCAGRVDGVDLELLQAMQSAGCWQILFGVESGSNRILNLIGKSTNTDLIRGAFALARRAGIKTYATFILGHPTETVDEAMQSIDFALELDPNIAEFFPATPFYGTELARRAAAFGEVNGGPENLGMHLAPFVPATMTRSQLMELRRRAHRTFYMRPAYVLKYLRGIRTWVEVADMFKGAATLLRDQLPSRGERPKRPGD
ncbi:MAG: radical SAM protein [Pseudomonadota bacterium]